MEHSGVWASRAGRSVSSVLAKKELLPVGALLVAVFLWGGSFAAMRIAVKALNPWAVMWCRMMIALILLLPLAGKLVPAHYRKGDWKLLIPMVLFQPCLYFLLESYALTYTTSSQAGVISASVPIMATIGAWLVLSESIPRKAFGGLLVSVTGVVCMTFLEGPGGVAENSLLGNAIEFCAMASAAANMVVVRQLSRRYSPWSLTAMQVLAGAIFFLPGLPFLLRAGGAVWNAQLTLALIFLGAFVTLGAFGLYNWGISRIPAARASAFINLVPVIAVLIGWGVLGETLTLAQSLAAGSVIAGVWLSQKS